MSAAKLTFFKLIVEDLEAQQAFYQNGFGFTVQDVFETESFGEVILRQPDAELMLILLSYRDGRPAPDAGAHGPSGFLTDDVEATHARLVALGAIPKGPIETVEHMRVAFLDDPEGHEIELVQFG